MQCRVTCPGTMSGNREMSTVPAQCVDENDVPMAQLASAGFNFFLGLD